MIKLLSKNKEIDYTSNKMLTKMKTVLAGYLAKELELTTAETFAALESPKDSQMGDLAFPCFSLSKKLRKAPPVIANEFSQRLTNLPKGFKKVQPIAGYLN